MDYFPVSVSFLSEFVFYGIGLLNSCSILLLYPHLGPEVAPEGLQAELLLMDVD